MELGRLLGSFLLIFLAEMGDKSQFLMVAMTSEFRVRDILCGVGGAVLILNLLAVTLGAAVGEWIPLSFVSIVAGVAFLTFAYLGLEDSEETYTGRRTGRAAWIGVLGTYFLAELGDKTQLTVLTLSAETGAHSIWEPITVLIASSIGLFAADAIGLAVGFVLGKRMPRTAFACPASGCRGRRSRRFPFCSFSPAAFCVCWRERRRCWSIRRIPPCLRLSSRSLSRSPFLRCAA